MPGCPPGNSSTVCNTQAFPTAGQMLGEACFPHKHLLCCFQPVTRAYQLVQTRDGCLGEVLGLAKVLSKNWASSTSDPAFSDYVGHISDQRFSPCISEPEFEYSASLCWAWTQMSLRSNRLLTLTWVCFYIASLGFLVFIQIHQGQSENQRSDRVAHTRHTVPSYGCSRGH